MRVCLLSSPDENRVGGAITLAFVLPVSGDKKRRRLTVNRETIHILIFKSFGMSMDLDILQYKKYTSLHIFGIQQMKWTSIVASFFQTSFALCVQSTWIVWSYKDFKMERRMRLSLPKGDFLVTPLFLGHYQSRCSSESVIQFRTNHQRYRWVTTFLCIECRVTHQPLQWLDCCGQAGIERLRSIYQRFVFGTSWSFFFKTLRFNRH